MKIRGRLVFKGEKAGDLASIIAQSLAPDNVPDMKTVIDGNSATVIFSGDKVGTILASVDDYLMNAKIASDMLRMK